MKACSRHLNGIYRDFLILYSVAFDSLVAGFSNNAKQLKIVWTTHHSDLSKHTL